MKVLPVRRSWRRGFYLLTVMSLSPAAAVVELEPDYICTGFERPLVLILVIATHSYSCHVLLILVVLV